MKNVITAGMLFLVGFLAYPHIQPIMDDMVNPDPENVEVKMVRGILKCHLQGFGHILIRVDEEQTHKRIWIYAEDMRLPLEGEYLEVLVEQRKIRLGKHHTYVYFALSVKSSGLMY